MAFASMPQPLTASALAKNILNNLLRSFDPVPDTIPMGSRVVALSDLVQAITSFRQQLRYLLDFGGQWPSAMLTIRGRQQASVWVPIDMQDGSGQDEHSLRHEIFNGTAQQRARSRVQAFNLPVSDRPASESERVFTDMLSEIVGRRFGGTTNVAGSAPPTAPFEVTTNSPGVEVLYADGFFLSTARGFGYSTPAKRLLTYGTYIFGHNTPTGADFAGGQLWNVPGDSTAHVEA
jgi:hypothetical protein